MCPCRSLSLRKESAMSHVRLEQPLRRSAHPFDEDDTLYASVFENAPHAMALIAPDGTILNANRSLCQILGFSRRELRSLRLGDITHPDDVDTELEQRQRLAACDIPRYELAQRYRRKDGTVIWVRLSVSSTRRISGAVENFIAQIECAHPHPHPHPGDGAAADGGDFKDATLSAMHEIANSLTPLMLNTEMLVEQSPGGQMRESAHEIFKAARRIAFALRRVWGVQEVQPSAYVGESRMLDLRLVAPPTESAAPRT